jgi:hypothetical protein
LLLRDTDFTSNRGDWKAGVQISRWTVASFNLQYRGQFSDNDYNNLPVSPPSVTEGYSAFIREREIDGGSLQALVTLRPCSWVRARLKYEHNDTQYYVNTAPVGPPANSPGGEINSGTSRGTQYQFSATLKPWRRVGLGGSLGYIDSDTSTARNDISSVADYSGYNWWARGTVAFVLSGKDDLFFSYEYWQSDFAQTQYSTGLPLGSEFSRQSLQVGWTRKWNAHLKSHLRYGFYDYRDPASGGTTDYTANGLFASLSYQWD